MKLDTYAALEEIRAAGIEIIYTKNGFHFVAKECKPELVQQIVIEIYERYFPGTIDWINDT